MGALIHVIQSLSNTVTLISESFNQTRPDDHVMMPTLIYGPLTLADGKVLNMKQGERVTVQFKVENNSGRL